jgi:dTDP-glucose pyrophosphorylase
MNNWQGVLVGLEVTIDNVIKVIDRSGLQIALVIDDDNRLIGTVTDGDIRRGLIKHVSLKEPVFKIMNKAPYVAHFGQSKEEMMQLLRDKGILQIPVIDAEGRVIDFENMQHLCEKTKHNSPVVIMAGGLGSRLLPLTKETPKPLLKVGEKSVLESLIEKFSVQKFHNFFISVNYKAEKIVECFGKGEHLGVNIEYLHEGAPLGTAGSLSLLRDFRQDIPIIVINADLVTNINFQQLLQFHKDNNFAATVCVREYDFQVPYGVVEVENFRVKQIVEKPIQRFFVNAGVYVLQPSLVSLLEKNQYIDMPDFLAKYVAEGEAGVFPIHEYWLDIGKMDDYEKAKKEFGVTVSE